MRALTLWQPWAWLVANGHKLVENRPWAPAATRLSPGERFAIHAGKRFEVGAWEDLLEVCHELKIFIPDRKALLYGAIIGTARFVSVGTRTEHFPDDQQVWFAGPFGWLLADARPISGLIPAKGSLGLWDLPPTIEKVVLEEEARPAA